MSEHRSVRVRVMTYNVRSLRDDARAVAEVIRAASPHVVCIQEAPRFARWRSKCAELARRSGMVVLGGGRPAAGNLLLCTLAVTPVSTTDLLLSPVPRLHRRGLAAAHLRLAGAEFAIAGTHLDVEASARLLHAGEIRQVLASLVPPRVPTILAGDMNDDPGSELWRAISTGRSDAWDTAHPDPEPVAGEAPGATSGPQDDPRRRIDYLFVPPPVRIRSAEVIISAAVDRASDHRPLLVELELRETYHSEAQSTAPSS